MAYAEVLDNWPNLKLNEENYPRFEAAHQKGENYLDIMLNSEGAKLNFEENFDFT